MTLEKALYLIPVTLGETEIRNVLPDYNHDVIVEIKHFIVENIRSARRFLKSLLILTSLLFMSSIVILTVR